MGVLTIVSFCRVEWKHSVVCSGDLEIERKSGDERKPKKDSPRLLNENGVFWSFVAQKDGVFSLFCRVGPGVMNAGCFLG
jgi:hypothetical protein